MVSPAQVLARDAARKEAKMAVKVSAGAGILLDSPETPKRPHEQRYHITPIRFQSLDAVADTAQPLGGKGSSSGATSRLAAPSLSASSIALLKRMGSPAALPQQSRQCFYAFSRLLASRPHRHPHHPHPACRQGQL